MSIDARRARHVDTSSAGAVAVAVATAAATVVGAATARASYGVLERHPPGGAQRWSRTNHAGRRVTLLEGPSVVTGVVVGAVVGALTGTAGRSTAGSVADLRRARALGLAGAGATLLVGAVGALDDLAGDPTTKGLGGHLSALRRGRLTTGALKIGGLAGAGVAVALTRTRTTRPRGLGGPVTRGAAVAGLMRALVGVAVDTGVVAGSANLVNLLDLRPGRALKVVVAAGVPLLVAGSPTGGAAVGAALVALPADLAGRRMLGDTGANALGAALGAAVVDRWSRGGRLALLGLLVGLTLLSERVSFTRVIESTPGLRELDAWGREPRVGAGA
ncbi:MAG: hypothetical protein M3Y71_10705 [Actinomycetota bacterium]|nr:hypothetical protein [Actinomycetota bacterium]